jgi:hypothetical protein
MMPGPQILSATLGGHIAAPAPVPAGPASSPVPGAILAAGPGPMVLSDRGLWLPHRAGDEIRAYATGSASVAVRVPVYARASGAGAAGVDPRALFAAASGAGGARVVPLGAPAILASGRGSAAASTIDVRELEAAGSGGVVVAPRIGIAAAATASGTASTKAAGRPRAVAAGSGAVVAHGAGKPASGGSGSGGVVVRPSVGIAASASGSGSSVVAATPAGLSFADNFDRTNASTLGANWTQGGTGSGIGIVSNCAQWSGTSDGLAWALYNATPNALMTDNEYTKGVVSGSVSATLTTRLVLRCNTAVTSFAYFSFDAGTVVFGRSNGSWSSTTDLVNVSTGITIANGAVIECWAIGNVFTMNVNGTQKISYTDTGNVIGKGSSNRRVAIGMRRSTFQNSAALTSWEARDWT